LAAVYDYSTGEFTLGCTADDGCREWPFLAAIRSAVDFSRAVVTGKTPRATSCA
jgi:hypothetical protein